MHYPSFGGGFGGIEENLRKIRRFLFQKKFA
jgi:hypothetical protein